MIAWISGSTWIATCHLVDGVVLVALTDTSAAVNIISKQTIDMAGCEPVPNGTSFSCVGSNAEPKGLHHLS